MIREEINRFFEFIFIKLHEERPLKIMRIIFTLVIPLFGLGWCYLLFVYSRMNVQVLIGWSICFLIFGIMSYIIFSVHLHRVCNVISSIAVVRVEYIAFKVVPGGQINWPFFVTAIFEPFYAYVIVDTEISCFAYDDFIRQKWKLVVNYIVNNVGSKTSQEVESFVTNQLGEMLDYYVEELINTNNFKRKNQGNIIVT
uniref:Uncharacterized protein n=1 Tax=Phalansterium sp. PJK-2012 TaxID=1267188 RepID=T1QDX5_9EUKA|nr:hypothetical protein [Phalansterium sp. PJK-2012]